MPLHRRGSAQRVPDRDEEKQKLLDQVTQEGVQPDVVSDNTLTECCVDGLIDGVQR